MIPRHSTIPAGALETKNASQIAAKAFSAVRTRLDFFPRKPANYQPFTEGAIGSGRKYDLQCKCKTIPLKMQMCIGRGASLTPTYHS